MDVYGLDRHRVVFYSLLFINASNNKYYLDEFKIFKNV